MLKDAVARAISKTKLDGTEQFVTSSVSSVQRRSMNYAGLRSLKAALSQGGFASIRLKKADSRITIVYLKWFQWLLGRPVRG